VGPGTAGLVTTGLELFDALLLLAHIDLDIGLQLGELADVDLDLVELGASSAALLVSPFTSASTRASLVAL
jgi:hypothetical protein